MQRSEKMDSAQERTLMINMPKSHFIDIVSGSEGAAVSRSCQGGGGRGCVWAGRGARAREMALPLSDR